MAQIVAMRNVLIHEFFGMNLDEAEKPPKTTFHVSNKRESVFYNHWKNRTKVCRLQPQCSKHTWVREEALKRQVEKLE